MSINNEKNVYIVTSPQDLGINTLRYAIERANSNITLSKIIIRPLGVNKIMITNEILIKSDIKIINETGEDLIITSIGGSRIFHILDPANWVKITSRCGKIKLTNGQSDANGGAIFAEPSFQNLFLKNVVIKNNSNNIIII